MGKHHGETFQLKSTVGRENTTFSIILPPFPRKTEQETCLSIPIGIQYSSSTIVRKTIKRYNACFIQLRFNNPTVPCSEEKVHLNLLDQTIAPNTHLAYKFKPGSILL